MTKLTANPLPLGPVSDFVSHLPHLSREAYFAPFFSYLQQRWHTQYFCHVCIFRHLSSKPCQVVVLLLSAKSASG